MSAINKNFPFGLTDSSIAMEIRAAIAARKNGINFDEKEFIDGCVALATVVNPSSLWRNSNGTGVHARPVYTAQSGGQHWIKALNAVGQQGQDALASFQRMVNAVRAGNWSREATPEEKALLLGTSGVSAEKLLKAFGYISYGAVLFVGGSQRDISISREGLLTTTGTVPKGTLLSALSNYVAGGEARRMADVERDAASRNNVTYTAFQSAKPTRASLDALIGKLGNNPLVQRKTPATPATPPADELAVKVAMLLKEHGSPKKAAQKAAKEWKGLKDQAESLGLVWAEVTAQAKQSA